MSSAPTLTDGTVTLRGPTDADVQGSWEQGQDPLSERWTDMPVPYTRDDARTYLRHIIPGGWDTEQEWGFVLEAYDGGSARFGGVVSLRNLGDGRAEVAYGSHPWIRGRGLVERAVRLLLEWGFAERGLLSVVWLARRGNWSSRRLAWRLGFSYEGTLRDWLPTRHGPVDAWAGTLRRGEPMSPRSPWLESPTLVGDGVVLRAMTSADLPRVVETENDPEVQRWLQGPRAGAPHTVENHGGFLLERLEAAAVGSAVHWAVAERTSDLYVGQVSLFGVHHRREAELAYWAHPEARGRGFTTEAARLVVRHCFVPWDDGGLGMHRLTADAAADNLASQRVLERAGFVRTGVERASTLMADGSWSDAVLYDQLVP